MSTRQRLSARPRTVSIIDHSSRLNRFRTASESTLNEVEEERNVDIEYYKNRKIVLEIVDKIFEDKLGVYERSSSRCSSIAMRDSEYSYDKRIKYWRDVIADRQQLADNVQEKTGKASCRVLFKNASTIDYRNKQMVQRLVDYAQRMNPITLMDRPLLKLTGYIDPMTCTQVGELIETLPSAERNRGTIVEISGMPTITKREQLDAECLRCAEKPFHWLNSKILEHRIDNMREDIERVVEYYPDIDNLQIVGGGVSKYAHIRHNPDIEILSDLQIQKISSSDTSLCVEEIKPPVKVSIAALIDYGVKINDREYKMLGKHNTKMPEIEIRLECEPFQHVVREVVRLENIGIKLLHFEFMKRPYYATNPTLQQANEKQFLFRHQSFRLLAEEVTELCVRYQPRRVELVKEKWILKINPHLTCRKCENLAITFIGICNCPIRYARKLERITQNVILKSNTQMVQTLATHLASLTPLIQPPEVVCPYERILDERQLFEFYNIGYICDRYHDLELLKDIHRRVKKPRWPAWDLKVDTLKSIIVQLPDAEQRALVFAELMGVLNEMKGTPIELEQKLLNNSQRDQSTFIFVRGIIATAIDEWETLAENVEESFMKTALATFYNHVAEDAQETKETDDIINLLLFDEVALREHLVNKVRHRKAFRDSLYLQTYTILCNFVEDIVSIIESTSIF